MKELRIKIIRKLPQNKMRQGLNFADEILLKIIFLYKILNINKILENDQQNVTT